MKKQIGFYVLKEEEVFTKYFECAAWYENIKVNPGKYPLYLDNYKVLKNGEVYGSFAFASLPGKIESDNFQSLFCGMPIGKTYDSTQNAGKEAIYNLQTYDYEIAKYAIKGKVELFPEYTVKDTSFKSDYDGHLIESYSIFLK